ncbi:MAG: glucose 1-dehydrogenase [Pseudomonadota bacterium]
MTNQWSVDLSGKVAVVTGGSRGIGKCVSEAFAASGASVVVASRKAEPCDELAAELTERYGVRCLGRACHVGDWDACDALIDFVMAEFGRIDILVNNAGMSPLYEELNDVTEALYDKVHSVNARGPFRLSSRAGTIMAAGEGGSIINVSSVAAVQPTPNELPYAVAKAGLNAMTIGLARNFGPKVRVNCIMPGPFLTDISKAWDMEAFAKRAEETIPLGRGGQPEEIVGAALYLASDLSSYTTGAVIKIDGGSAFPAA